MWGALMHVGTLLVCIDASSSILAFHSDSSATHLRGRHFLPCPTFHEHWLVVRLPHASQLVGVGSSRAASSRGSMHTLLPCLCDMHSTSCAGAVCLVMEGVERCSAALQNIVKLTLSLTRPCSPGEGGGVQLRGPDVVMQ
jgi:hypothetical protein